MEINRRNFLTQSTFAASLPLIGFAPKVSSINSRLFSKINFGDIILFQGDSITDAGREKERELHNKYLSLGTGYSFLVAANLLKALPKHNLSIYNRGISGNKVYQLAERWEKDALELKPNWISIMIGVNDYWHKKNGYQGTVKIYENDLRNLLQQTLETLPNVKFILCEPFVLPGTTAVDESWVMPFSEYQSVAQKLAEEFNAIWVPFQEEFNLALKDAPPTYWAPDGVHPSVGGSQLMADLWLRTLENS